MEPVPTPGANDQIAELERQIGQLKHRAVLELKVKLAEARALVVELQDQIAKYTGGTTEQALEKAKERKPRSSVTIGQIVEAIRAGATNHKMLEARLGVSAQTVARRIKEEGEKAGITSTGQKSTFRLIVR